MFGRRRLHGTRRRPPWWFMPLVMSGMGLAALLLSYVLLHGME